MLSKNWSLKQYVALIHNIHYFLLNWIAVVILFKRIKQFYSWSVTKLKILLRITILRLRKIKMYDYNIQNKVLRLLSLLKLFLDIYVRKLFWLAPYSKHTLKLVFKWTVDCTWKNASYYNVQLDCWLVIFTQNNNTTIVKFLWPNFVLRYCCTTSRVITFGGLRKYKRSITYENLRTLTLKMIWYSCGLNERLEKQFHRRLFELHGSSKS